MAKFQSKKTDLTVSVGSRFITFKNGNYETTNKDEIEVLEKCIDVIKVDGRRTTVASTVNNQEV